MQLTSLTYLLLLLLSVPVYLLLPARLRPAWLLLVSLGFYAAPYWPHALLIVGLALAVYAVGQLLQHRRRPWLFASAIGGCVAILAYFKYARWLLTTLAEAATALHAAGLAALFDRGRAAPGRHAAHSPGDLVFSPLSLSTT